MEAVGGSALAIGSIGGVIYLTPEPNANATAARLGAPTPSHASPAASGPSSLSLGGPLGALLGAVLLLLAAVLLAKQGSGGGGARRRKGGAPRLGLLDVGDDGSFDAGADAQEEDNDMRYHALLPSTVEGH